MEKKNNEITTSPLAAVDGMDTLCRNSIELIRYA